MITVVAMCSAAIALLLIRIIWTIVFRELSFGGAAWLLAGAAPGGWRGPSKTALITVGRTLVAIAVIVFGIEHFLHSTGLPGVPLQKQMPTWVPGRVLIDYLTGLALLVTGGSILLARNTRVVATCVGGWILLLVLVVYGPVLVLALSEPGTGIKLEGINYFADTLLFAGTILALASASPGFDWKAGAAKVFGSHCDNPVPAARPQVVGGTGIKGAVPARVGWSISRRTKRSSPGCYSDWLMPAANGPTA